MKTNSFLLTAIFGLALAFTFSCSSDDGGGGDNKSSSSVANDGKGKSSSSSLGLSSPEGSGSSSSGDKGGSSSSAGAVYKTIKIGNQTWMAENLNIAASGSKCYDGKSANCGIYGRLYDWETAKSICPSGWHLPSNEEWETLIDSYGEEAGTKLKAANGFAALPGGYGDSDGDFSYAEEYGYWWTATEEDEDYAWRWNIDYEYEEVSSDYDDKTKLYSVRCVQNTQTVKSSSSVGGGVSSSSIAGGGSSGSTPSSNSNMIINPEFNDPRCTTERVCSNYLGYCYCYSDPSSSSQSTQTITFGPSVTYEGETYETVVIGTQTWFKSNLNYALPESKCYHDEPANCEIYGRLYYWSDAMGMSASCIVNKCPVAAKHKGICPSGWHIPNDNDWKTLVNYVGTDAGTKLKTISGWKTNSGEDTYGFSALPGGHMSYKGSSGNIGEFGNWWSATINNGRTIVSGWRMGYNEKDVTMHDYSTTDYMHSVRCVKD